MNTLSKLTLISVMISAMAGCSVRKDGNNLSNVTTADSLLFTEPLDTLPDGVISSVSWLPLQNSDQRIIDEISKLSVVDSFIVIGSRRQAVLQVYSTEGKFLYEISEKGQGPEEYLEIATFTVTPASIYILDNFSHKISRYTLEKGTFMGKTEVPFVAWDMEAFDDNDFLFTCLNNNPDVKVSPSPVDFAVWRTDSHWQITDKYLPVEKEYTELYGKSRYFTRYKHDIVFHSFQYDGFFTFSRKEDPVFHPILFSRPFPRDNESRLKEANSGQWQLLAETPFVVDGYNIVEISIAGQGQQMFAVNASNKIFGNSEVCPKNIPINIIGTMGNHFVGYINDNYELYRNLVAYGFQKGSPEAEDILSRGGCCLIIYSVGNL